MFIGLDFGTLSVRGVIVDTTTPKQGMVASRVRSYQEQVIELSDGGCVFADADAWVHAGQEVLEDLYRYLQKEKIALDLIKSVGVTFTSCTVVPINSEGIPLSSVFRQSDPRKRPHVFSKMWKHHSPSVQKCADDLTQAIKKRPEERWLNEVYGGQLGLEWLYPKSLEVYDKDKEAFDAVFAFVEGGDYVVWALLGRKLPVTEHLIRSSQQAGYKGCFVNGNSLIKPEILREIRPEMTEEALNKFNINRFKVAPPGSLAGYVNFGGGELNLPLSVASIDAHACALGQGAFRKGRLVLVMGTSACFMISTEPPHRPLQGAAGFVPNGIVQGLYAYEFGQSAAGDVFAWLARIANSIPTKMETDSVRLLRELVEEGKELECWAVDHLNGCRTPLMRGDARGSIHNISLSTTPIHIFLAFMEAISFGIKVVVRMLENAGIQVNEIVLSGGGLAKNRVFRSILSTVLNRRILVFRDDGEATSRGAAAYASLIGAQSLEHLTKFEPFESLQVSPSSKVLSVLGNELRFQRYATAASVRSFI